MTASPPVAGAGYSEDQLAAIRKASEAWQKKMTENEKATVLDAIKKVSPDAVVDGAVMPCGKSPKKKKPYCVDPSQKAGASEELKEAIAKKVQGDADPKPKVLASYDQIMRWEGNYRGAYVPWGPVLVEKEINVGTPGEPRKVKVMQAQEDRDKRGLKGWKVDKYTNSSGVSVGAGYDLGARDSAEIRRSMRRAAKDSGLMDPSAAKALGDKLAKYAGLKRSAACAKLKAEPLVLTQQEVDVINYASLSSHTKDAMEKYESLTGKDWSDLSEQEQTIVVSKVYHTGHIDEDLAEAIAEGDQAAVLEELKGQREADYAKAYFMQRNAPPPNSAPPQRLGRGPVPLPGI